MYKNSFISTVPFSSTLSFKTTFSTMLHRRSSCLLWCHVMFQSICTKGTLMLTHSVDWIRTFFPEERNIYIWNSNSVTVSKKILYISPLPTGKSQTPFTAFVSLL